MRRISWAWVGAALFPLGAAASAQEAERPAAIVTDDPRSPAVASLKVLLRGGVKVIDCSARAPDAADLLGTRGAVSVLKDPRRIDPRTLARFAEGGATVVLGLDEYAALVGGRVSESRIENPQRVRLGLSSPEAVEDYGRAWEDYWRGRGIDAKYRAIRDSLLEEIREPIPSIETVAEDPALRGFPAGSVIPWASEGPVYCQQHLDALPAGATVLARSTVGGKPAILRHDLVKGRLYALPLRGLPEPRRCSWESRGGFNKWVPVTNLLSRGVLGGTYWNRKPSYAEYCGRLRAVAERCPGWRLETVGSYRLDGREVEKIYGFLAGDASRPLWVILGMLHAEDEWVPALGALDFVEYVERHRGDPEIAAVLKEYGIRVIPLLHPSAYESTRFEYGAPRPGDRLDPEVTRRDVVHAAMQLHQGGDSIVTAVDTPNRMGKRIGDTVRRLCEGRSVLWRDMAWKSRPGVLEPMQPEDWTAESVIGGPVPEWDGYWIQGAMSCYGIYRLETMMRARALHFLEQPMMGFMPDAFSSSLRHHWAHRSVFEAPGYMTLWETDQTVAYCLAFILTPVPKELERRPR